MVAAHGIQTANRAIAGGTFDSFPNVYARVGSGAPGVNTTGVRDDGDPLEMKIVVADVEPGGRTLVVKTNFLDGHIDDGEVRIATGRRLLGVQTVHSGLFHTNAGKDNVVCIFIVWPAVLNANAVTGGLEDFELV